MSDRDLRGVVAVVTGASRGAGRGIALALGEAGATVYVTGRSVRGGKTTDGMRGTVEDTADEVRRRGGVGVAVRCDQASDAEVAALFARVEEEQGRLDILVNNAWAGNEGGYDGQRYDDGSHWGTPFWERSERLWPRMMDGGARLSLTATRHAARLLVAQKRGLVVCTTSTDRGRYLGDFYYDLAKATINRLAFGMAQDLRPHGVACVALSPGWMRTERVIAAGVEDPRIESVEYVGRAVVALWASGTAFARTGETLVVANLARELGFTDVDGRQPGPFELP
jgi:NAD(P)-dependent dehydrogenase (short-subunit alcohol dehydrogenase family)